MIKNNTFWFTLIEIMISTMILSIGVFWVYKLIGSNMSVITSMWNDMMIDSLVLNSKECLKNIWYENLKSWDTKFFLDFWNDYTLCNTWIYDNTFSNSWMIIDNLEYYIIPEITNSWSTFIDFNIKVIWDWSKEVIETFTIEK